MKRFTATEKWSDPWFRKLTPRLKTFWLYLCDACDHAGIWQADFELASFIIGEEVTVDDLNQHFEGRCVSLVKGRMFIPKFIEFQYGPELNPENSAHRGVIRAMEAAQPGLSGNYLAPAKPLPSPCQGAKDKDKDKDQDTDRKGEPGKTDDAKPQSKEQKRAALAALYIRVGGIFQRRPETKWSDKEKQSLDKLFPLADEQLALIERYYTDNINPTADFRRRSLLTLLNNWPGEVDRANRHFGLNGHASKPQRQRSTD